MATTLEAISFNYSEEDAKLFQNEQDRHWRNIEEKYLLLRNRCMEEIPTPVQTTQNIWVRTRTNRLLTTSIMRLLYLTESFRDSAIQFNAPATAVQVKAMVEPGLHIANLAWVLENHRNNFDSIRVEFDRMAFGRRDRGELTTRARISHRDLYRRADTLLSRLENTSGENHLINVFETIYQEANATGHHNFEGRDTLIGVTDTNNTWHPRDRKEWFTFMSSNIFQFFLHTSTIFTMSHIFIGMIDHYLEHLPER